MTRVAWQRLRKQAAIERQAFIAMHTPLDNPPEVEARLQKQRAIARERRRRILRFTPFGESFCVDFIASVEPD